MIPGTWAWMQFLLRMVFTRPDRQPEPDEVVKSLRRLNARISIIVLEVHRNIEADRVALDEETD